MAQDPYKYFRQEARDLIDQLAKGVLDLEQGGEQAPLVRQLLRIAHTLKGAARVVKQQGIANHAHAIEDTLVPLREGSERLRREQIDAILKQVDQINASLKELSPVQQDARAVLPEESVRDVRSDLAEVDVLLDGIAETHALIGRLRTAFHDMERVQIMADLLSAQLAPQPRAPSPGAERLFPLAEELGKRLGGLRDSSGTAVDQMGRELHQLRDAAEQLRLTPAAGLFTSLERTARDTARALSKEIAFQAGGGDLRLDLQIIGTVRGALVQLVRNAVAHGIELPQERRAAGKAEAGLVRISVLPRGRQVVFECHDDGRGLDLEAVQREAVRRGLASPQVERNNAGDVLRLLMRGGISTSSAITEMSGRGVGLDIVREAMERLGGEVTVTGETGTGTTFQLIVPRSLSSIEALSVEVSGATTVIPLDAVRQATRLRNDDILRTGTGASISYEDKAIPFLPLSSILGRSRQTNGRSVTAVVIAGAGGLAALGVDRLLGTSRVVVHPLPDHAPSSAVASGAVLDAEGRPQLVLDADGLCAEVIRGSADETEAATQKASILVIDDSLTTRMLEQSILESAGYDVDVATSGEEALERARVKRYALFLVDVEMPGISGFQFIEHIRADSLLRDTPAVLVTSLDAPEDRQRGRDAGAQGYVVKSEFDQAELLTLIKDLVR